MATPLEINSTKKTASEALHRLKSTELPVWLAPSPELSQATRIASQQLFSYLKPFSPKSPFDQLLVDGFDAEQIWQQIDLQSQPLLSSLRREVKKFEKNPEELLKLKKVLEGKESKEFDEEDDDMDMDADGFSDSEEEEGEDGGGGEKGDKEEGQSEENREDEDEDEEKGNGDGIEDKFFKINDLEEYLEDGEAREMGLTKSKKENGKGQRKIFYDDEEEDEEGEDEDEDEEDGFEASDDKGENADELENARYEDFFGGGKKVSIRKPKLVNGSEDDLEDEKDDEKGKNGLSTHEKELENLKSKIEQMEKANLEPKDWTMQGEVTAAQRPKNSALEVDLDFEHNVRPAPVITEEVTASLEDMIKNRILEAKFDDVQRAPSLPSKAPRELKELDENKSKKGLGEVYEEEYVQKANPDFAPSSFSDEQKKEASMLFKRLCLKLDALSRFHFTPKPIIEDMSIQANVPALAVEEIAPLAVSDAAMLAPEEVFAGKGDVKEEVELTKAERKRRRANKKRKFKAGTAKRMEKKKQINTIQNQNLLLMHNFG
ncbi:U3 small nucleolar ribonucleoprotein protein MPP10 isoform X1 [Carica papaya]|uniref:U3 small nucleolar ribonucleoprotein protein MPP10 isoform X1 n=1 Tax=Carica papaya TaxID=3649 RepID=UPI000B8C6E32|nr:U3 small nucleolar ribonucleoprotein protein MPP10 isoform X1 [Carica papaya]